MGRSSKNNTKTQEQVDELIKKYKLQKENERGDFGVRRVRMEESK
jgi:hypothetical protein